MVSGLVHETDWDWEVLDPTQQLHDKRSRARLAAELERELSELRTPAPNPDA